MQERHSDILIVGSDYRALIFSHYFVSHSATVLLTGEVAFSPIPEKFSYLGNGEFLETAEKIFGKELKSLFWELSQSNLEEILRVSKALDLKAIQSDVVWQKENKTEKGIAFQTESIPTQTPLFQTQDPLSFDRENGELLVTDSTTKYHAKIVILVDDYLAVKNFPYLKDKCIPVTLSMYCQPQDPNPQPLLELFHAGSDYVFHWGSNRYFGSYRNLYEDKAVGITGPDIVSEQNIRRVFGANQRLDPGKNLKTHLVLESLSCDGLPIIGTLPNAPNLYVCIGFSGRTQNFLFEIAKRMAEGILGQGKFPGLERFSIKRLAI